MSDRAPLRLRFGKRSRLRQRGEFARIRQDGRRVVKGCLIANWTQLPVGSTPKLGVITTRKLGKAHVRSRARRLLREAFRLHQHDLREPVSMVLIARASVLDRKLNHVEREYLALLKQAGLLKSNP